MFVINGVKPLVRQTVRVARGVITLATNVFMTVSRSRFGGVVANLASLLAIASMIAYWFIGWEFPYMQTVVVVLMAVSGYIHLRKFVADLGEETVSKSWLNCQANWAFVILFTLLIAYFRDGVHHDRLLTLVIWMCVQRIWAVQTRFVDLIEVVMAVITVIYERISGEAEVVNAPSPTIVVEQKVRVQRTPRPRPVAKVAAAVVSAAPVEDVTELAAADEVFAKADIIVDVPAEDIFAEAETADDLPDELEDLPGLGEADVLFLEAEEELADTEDFEAVDETKLEPEVEIKTEPVVKAVLPDNQVAELLKNASLDDKRNPKRGEARRTISGVLLTDIPRFAKWLEAALVEAEVTPAQFKSPIAKLATAQGDELNQTVSSLMGYIYTRQPKAGIAALSMWLEEALVVTA